ncbi:MAG: hypothetical protein ABEH64_13340 [Salinirussus sp.]
MSRVGREGDDREAPPTGDARLTAKVVMMELAGAGGPLSAAAIAERTLLAEEAVKEACERLASAGLCRVYPADDRRPRRYATDEATPRNG